MRDRKFETTQTKQTEELVSIVAKQGKNQGKRTGHITDRGMWMRNKVDSFDVTSV